jgi:hypothetical protein
MNGVAGIPGKEGAWSEKSRQLWRIEDERLVRQWSLALVETYKLMATPFGPKLKLTPACVATI